MSLTRRDAIKKAGMAGLAGILGAVGYSSSADSGECPDPRAHNQQHNHTHSFDAGRGIYAIWKEDKKGETYFDSIATVIEPPNLDAMPEEACIKDQIALGTMIEWVKGWYQFKETEKHDPAHVDQYVQTFDLATGTYTAGTRKTTSDQEIYLGEKVTNVSRFKEFIVNTDSVYTSSLGNSLILGETPGDNDLTKVFAAVLEADGGFNLVFGDYDGDGDYEFNSTSIYSPQSAIKKIKKIRKKPQFDSLTIDYSDGSSETFGLVHGVSPRGVNKLEESCQKKQEPEQPDYPQPGPGPGPGPTPPDPDPDSGGGESGGNEGF